MVNHGPPPPNPPPPGPSRMPTRNQTSYQPGELTDGSLNVAESEEGVLISEGDQKVLFYQCKGKSLEGKFERAGYVHPLYDLDGNALTEDFPEDHRHHRGIFWAWHQLWVEETRIGDPWVTRDFSWDVRDVQVLRGDESAVALQATVLWKSPLWVDRAGMPKPVVEETTTIRVHRATKDARKIDFKIQLLAMEDNLRLGCSEGDKTYGGFSPRVWLPEDVRFTATYGPAKPQDQSVEASPWMDISGSYAKAGGLSGITILCHPSMPGFPQRWILRQGHGIQNPVYPGRELVLLSTATPLVLYYRLVLHRGGPDHSQIEKWQAEFSQ